MWSSSERRKIEIRDSGLDRLDRSGIFDNGIFSGNKVQVSRLGNPLVNEVVIPLGRKDEFNRTEPDEDAERFGEFVLKPELAAILNQLFDVGAPTEDRTDIMQALLQDIPGLNQLDRGDDPLPTAGASRRRDGRDAHAGMSARTAGEGRAAQRYLRRALDAAPRFSPLWAPRARRALEEL